MSEEKTTIDELVEITKSGFKTMDERFDGVDGRFRGIDERLESMDKRLTKVEALMVTKDYLDDKLADLKGDLTVLMRKEDTKLKALVQILAEKKVITSQDKDRIFGLEPFPELKIV